MLHNLSERYLARPRAIYTWTSHVLTAINPYEELPSLYADSLLEQLPQLPPRELPPHAFSVAEIACRGVARGRGSQTVVVSGESGAGKTYTMAHVMDDTSHTVHSPPRALPLGAGTADSVLRVAHR